MVRALAAATILATCIAALPASAEPRTFIVPDHDGYGLGGCLGDGPASACGRVVANAWCAAQGQGRAADFGRSDARETTATVAPTAIAKAGALFVTCE